MENMISKNWYLVLLKGIIMIALAALLFNSPVEALLGYVMYMSIAFGITGIIRIIQGFQAKDVVENWGFIIIEGVLDLVLAYILMVHPGITITLIPFLIGFWALMYGLYMIVDAFSGDGNLILKLLFGILTILVAHFIMFNPLMMGMSMMLWFAVMLFVVGIYNVIISFKIKNL